MRILLVGNGAREHAIAEKLCSDEDTELYSIMSKKNPAIAQLAKKFWLCDINNPEEVYKTVKGQNIDIGFASPDSTLAAGISDALAKADILVASPSKSASRIEWDKSYLRSLIQMHRIGGAVEHRLFSTAEEAQLYIRELGNVAIKPLGLTGGKGVRVSGDHFSDAQQAIAYASEIIRKEGKVLIEEKVDGEEFSLQAFCDGKRIFIMPPVQDFKRAYEGDKGPNTGGQGSYSAGKLLPFMDKSDLDKGEKILQEIVYAMRKDGNPFHGVIYGQFMVCNDGVKVIEINSRFGDPEAMNVLALLDSSLVDILLSITDENLEHANFKNSCTVVKYLVPNGYPEKPKADREITVDGKRVEGVGAKAYYASVYEKDGKIFTTSSRAIAMLGVADNLEEAEEKAEKACNAVSGDIWHRSDIAKPEAIEKRVEHIRAIRQ